MKTVILFVAIMTVDGLVASLDATHTFANSDDFWDTNGYVNVTPSTKVGLLPKAVDGRVKDVRESTAPNVFSTFPPGLTLVIY